MNQRAGMWQNVKYFKQSLSEISSNISLICSQIFHKCVSYTTPKRTKINKYWKPCFRKLHTHPGTLTSWTINLSASAKTERFPLNDISSLTCAITRVSVNKDNIHASLLQENYLEWPNKMHLIMNILSQNYILIKLTASKKNIYISEGYSVWHYSCKNTLNNH